MSSMISFDCSGPELFHLCSLAGGETLVGVRDPFSGWLAEEIQEAMAQARKELIGQGHLDAGPDGQIGIARSLAPLIDAVTFPAAVLMNTLIAAGEAPVQQTFYCRPQATVQLSAQRGNYRLGLLDAPEAVFHEIVDCWGLNAQTAAQGEVVALPEVVLAQARQLIHQERSEEACATLMQAGARVAAARAVVAALSAPRRNGAIVALRPEGSGWYPAGMGMLESENGLWRLRSFEQHRQPWVELLPGDASEVAEALHRLVVRFVTLGPRE